MKQSRAVKYNKSKLGLISRTFYGQLKRSKSRGHKPPMYTRDELFDWCSKQQLFHELYALWVLSGYELKMRPTIDRKKDSLGYSFTNIQLMSFSQNVSKPNLGQFKNGHTPYNLKT